MRVWLELNQQEGEKLFDTVKGFTVDRMQTAVMGATAEVKPEIHVLKAEIPVAKADTPENIPIKNMQESAPLKEGPSEENGVDLKDSKKVEKTKAAKSEPQEITLPMVRAAFTELKRAGKMSHVVAIIKSYTDGDLTNIPADKYPELMAKAEALK